MLFIRPSISPPRSPTTLDSFVKSLAAEDIARQREKVIDILGRNQSGRLILEACKNLDVELGILRKSWLTLPEDDPRSQLVFTILEETKLVELNGKNTQMQQHFEALQNTLEGQDLLRHQQLWEIEWKRKAANLQSGRSDVKEQEQGRQTEMRLQDTSRSKSCQDISTSSLAKLESARKTRPRSNTAPSGSRVRPSETRRRRKPKLTLDILFEPRPACQPLPCFPRAIFEHPGTSTNLDAESIQSTCSNSQGHSSQDNAVENTSTFTDGCIFDFETGGSTEEGEIEAESIIGDSSDSLEDVDEEELEQVEREEDGFPCYVLSLGGRPPAISLPLALVGAIGIVLTLLCIGLLSSVQVLMDRLDDVLRGRRQEVKS
ncbi:hypothetical protein CYLTODRAFT_488075 [Cylindrobasidium torrendii FP15055 ss-10]|uniref:Uncharacterized protein n=1 Tax=Cylindrobasidium torrendii FP15055 ss-10 TaxID=1314674 RepID=A0A0D7BIW7_9AGAR|nr:hypothetical protein CYLTODRAFT_488075 [Cylindrobasidium torrendii FP15055 ss-10]